MFKVNKNDIFAKNMSGRELYLTWQKLKAETEMDKIIAKLVVQLDKKYKV